MRAGFHFSEHLPAVLRRTYVGDSESVRWFPPGNQRSDSPVMLEMAPAKTQPSAKVTAAA